VTELSSPPITLAVLGVWNTMKRTSKDGAVMFALVNRRTRHKSQFTALYVVFQKMFTYKYMVRNK
jgi:hypothetical protein